MAKDEKNPDPKDLNQESEESSLEELEKAKADLAEKQEDLEKKIADLKAKHDQEMRSRFGYLLNEPLKYEGRVLSAGKRHKLNALGKEELAKLEKAGVIS